MTTNESNPHADLVDLALLERASALATRAKNYPVFAVIGVFIPMVGLIASGLGLLYFVQARRLLRDVGTPTGELAGHIAVITRRHRVFLLPAIALFVGVVIFSAMLMLS